MGEATAVAVLVGVVVGVAALLWVWPARRGRTRASDALDLMADRRRVGGAESPSGLRAPNAWRWLPGAARPRPVARGPTTDEVAGAMMLLAVALQSGCGVVEAIEAAAAVAPSAAERELGVVAAALRWGVSDDRAWSAVSPWWARTAVALRLAAVSGVAPSSLLMSGAADLRASRLAAVEVSAARLEVRLVVPLGVAFLPAFVLTTVVPVVLAVARQVLEP